MVTDVTVHRLVATSSVRRSSSLDWKKIEIELNPTAKTRPPVAVAQILNFFGCQLRCLSKYQKTKKNRSRPVATGLSSHRVLDLTCAHFSLIVGL